MIGYLEGIIWKKEADRVLLLVQSVGYEVLLPAFLMETVSSKKGESLSLFIYYHQTERQPKPLLIGFLLEAEKEFFQQFITVEDVGVVKAVKALTLPIAKIARAIEAKDVNVLKNLKGIGGRTADKIIATLNGKMEKYVLIREDMPMAPAVDENIEDQVLDVLVGQLGHKRMDAKQMIHAAFDRNPSIKTAEGLFEEIYRGEAL